MSTQIFDCLTYLHTAYLAEAHKATWQSLRSDPLLAACSQAEATRHAGKLAARAATNAYLFTLLAGILAFIGGLCIIVPVLLEQRQKRRASAMHLLNLIQPIQSTEATYLKILDKIYGKKLSPPETPFQVVVPALPKQFVDLDWMEHSRLSRSCLQSIRSTTKQLSDLHFAVAMLAEPRLSNSPLEQKDLSLKGAHFSFVMEHCAASNSALAACTDELKRASGLNDDSNASHLPYLFELFGSLLATLRKSR
jgi:hypothetical protein